MAALGGARRRSLLLLLLGEGPGPGAAGRAGWAPGTWGRPTTRGPGGRGRRPGSGAEPSGRCLRTWGERSAGAASAGGQRTRCLGVGLGNPRLAGFGTAAGGPRGRVRCAAGPAGPAWAPVLPQTRVSPGRAAARRPRPPRSRRGALGFFPSGRAGAPAVRTRGLSCRAAGRAGERGRGAGPHNGRV